MNRKAWKSKVKKACINAGTYKSYFDHVINELAGILEKRDEVEEIYNSEGLGPVIEFTNKNGSTNAVKNPLLVMWDDFNKSALAYWRDLGLTPAGLKKINDASFVGEKPEESSLFGRLEQQRQGRKI